MKYRIVATIILVLVLFGVVSMSDETAPRSTAPASAGAEDSTMKNLKID